HSPGNTMSSASGGRHDCTRSRRFRPISCWPMSASMCSDCPVRIEERPMVALTQDIARFVTELSPQALPGDCREAARIGMLDCVGVMIAGSDEEPARLVSGI